MSCKMSIIAKNTIPCFSFVALVGIESVNDIINDFKVGLKAVEKATA